MNENHQRHLLVTLRHLDRLLSGTEGALASAGSSSPFAEYTQDSTPVQRKVVRDLIERARGALVRAITELGLPRPVPVCGALWAARGQITFASIAIAEMEPKRMRGYGPLSAADVATMERVVAELNAALAPLSAFLDQGPAADLQARLDRLEQTRDEVPLVRELERIITRQGLVESRGALARLLDRMENGVFEIGLFGRVSSGKSSLLNHLLGTEVLPVGVTPVTAIPTRIRFGPQPRALIEFADAKPLEIELTRLADFATEQQNPANAKHVARIGVEVPSGRLREGVTFVDTPGLGSLATGGAEETVAYLPRCDLGLVLVDAAATLSHEDLAVVRALQQAGARAMLLVSKADLLPPADRERMLEYARRQAASQLGAELPVHAVSVVGAEAALCDQWLEHELQPLLETHRDQASRALKRKVGALRETVVNALEVRRHRVTARPGALEAAATLRGADALIEADETACGRPLDEMSDLAPALIARAADELAASWQARGQAAGAMSDPAAVCSMVLRRTLALHTGRVVERLEALERRLEESLAAARIVLGAAVSAGEPLPRLAGLPLFDPAGLLAGADLRAPRLASLGGKLLLRPWARSRLERMLGETLPSALGQYRRQLRQWLREALAGLRVSFHAQADPISAQLEPPQDGTRTEGAASTLEADIAGLRAWAVGEGGPSRAQGGESHPESWRDVAPPNHHPVALACES